MTGSGASLAFRSHALHNAAMEDAEESPAPIGITATPPVLAPDDLLGVARGFSRILWSIPLGLFLFTRAMDFAISLYFRLPSYIIAVCLCFWGLTALRRITPFSRAWARYLRMSFLLVFLLLYFAPFIYWWTRHPAGDHFVINLFGMVLAATWLLWAINRMAQEVALALRDRVFFIESRLCGWSVLAFMFAPLLVYAVYVSVRAAREDMPLFHIIEGLRFIAYAQWILALMLLPLTLTIAIAWKTKERAFDALKTRAGQASPPARSVD
jgi:hypothetical protein